MKFYKSFLFILGLDALLAAPILWLLGFRFIIPAALLLIFFNLFLLFFPGLYLKKSFNFSVLSPEEAYGAGRAFEELKRGYDFEGIRLLKAENLTGGFFFFCSGGGYFVVVSRDILENLPKESIKILLAYPFYLIKKGDGVFLSLLSGFLFAFGGLFYILSRPFSVFKKKKEEGLGAALIFKILSFITKRIFFNADKNLLLSKDEKEPQALALLQLESLTRLQPPKIILFTAPLFLINPLTKRPWLCYISLQPSVKSRIRALSGGYPPKL